MKRKDYEKLLNKIEEANLVYGGWVLEIADYNPADGNYSYEQLEKERDKAKTILDGYKAELEDILTVDMEVFAKDILEYINEIHEKEYEIVDYDLDGGKLWLARPIGKRIMDTEELIENLEDVYVLGKDNKKILPLQTIKIDTNIYPTICSVLGKYSAAYNELLGGYLSRYRKFYTYMREYEEKLVEFYEPKKNNKR